MGVVRVCRGHRVANDQTGSARTTLVQFDARRILAVLKLRLNRRLQRKLKRRAKREQKSSTELAVSILKKNLNINTKTLEQRLTELERRLGIKGNVDKNHFIHAKEDYGVFFHEADQPESAFKQSGKDHAYQHWLKYYEENLDQVEPGRSAHEMAALKASIS